MLTVFKTVLDMSLTASIVILAVMIARGILSKAPKKYSYLLWSVVAFRLCFPFSFESVFSIFSLGSRSNTFPTQSSVTHLPTTPAAPDVSDAGSVPTTAVTPNVGTTVTPGASAPNNPSVTSDVTSDIPAPAEMDWESIIGTALAVIWLVGIAAMLIYGMVSYFKLNRRLQTAVRLEGNVYGSDRIGSPFALGIFKPRIYIPFGLASDASAYILAHERYHLKRLDHMIKPLSFLILSVHWFNPLCWLAFNRMSLDMEMSCDEKILKQYGDENMKKQYTRTLLAFATDRRFPAPGPIAFSEGAGAKKRIKHALYFKKPKFWISTVALVLCAVVLVACAANAVDQENNRIETFDDTPYKFEFVSNGDGTCKIVDIKTDFEHTEKFDLVIPEKSPEGDKVTEVDMNVLGLYGNLNVPAVLTKNSFEALLAQLQSADSAALAGGITAEQAVTVVNSFYSRHLDKFDTHSLDDNYTFVTSEKHISAEEYTRISEYLSSFIGYTAEDCYQDSLKVLELNVSESDAALLKEKAFRYFYHSASNIAKVVLPNADIKVHQGFLGLSYTTADGTAVTPAYENPVSISVTDESADIELDSDGNYNIRVSFARPVRNFSVEVIDESEVLDVSMHPDCEPSNYPADTQYIYRLSLNDATSTRGISFVGEDNRTHCYAIVYNGSGKGEVFYLKEIITDQIDQAPYTNPVTVAYSTPEEEAKLTEPNYLHYIDQYATHAENHPELETVIVGTTETITDYCFFVLENSESLYASKVLFTGMTLEPGQNSVLYTYISETLPNRGIGFKGSDGVMRCYAIVYSGADGSLSLTDITDTVQIPLSLTIRRATDEDKGGDNDSYLRFEDPDATSLYDLIIETNRTVSHLNVCKLSVNDYSDERGWLYTADPFDIHLGNLTPEKPLFLTVYPASITDTYGISFTDTDGKVRYFAIFESEMDGTILLTEVTDQMAQ